MAATELHARVSTEEIGPVITLAGDVDGRAEEP